MLPRVGEQALCAALGVLAAAWLWAALHAHGKPGTPNPAKVAVKMAAQKQPAPAARDPRVQTPVLPLKTDKVPTAAKKRTPKQTAPTLPATQPEPIVAEPAPDLDLPTITQPPLAMPQTGRGPVDLPVIATADAPPAPPEPQQGPTLAFSDLPGGEVAILGLLVDDAGITLDVRLLVNSKHPVSDISLVFAHMGKKWTDIEPPLAPGEKRWIQLRFDYGNKNPIHDPIP